jgi:aspartate/methionine/tyrosine aminotransferase
LKKRIIFAENDDIPTISWRKKIVFKYPNNPTGAMLMMHFMNAPCGLRIYMTSLSVRCAYCEIAYDGYNPRSILEFDREKILCRVPFMSKTYCLTAGE